MRAGGLGGGAFFAGIFLDLLMRFSLRLSRSLAAAGGPFDSHMLRLAALIARTSSRSSTWAAGVP